MRFEDDLLSELNNFISNGKIKICDDNGKYFLELSQAYPICGSKIDWDKVDKSVVSYATGENCDAQFIDFFKAMVHEYNLREKCVVIGDSAIDKALLMDISTLNTVLQKIIEIPQHHYILASDYSWCLTFTMEQEMAFGYKPK